MKKIVLIIALCLLASPLNPANALNPATNQDIENQAKQLASRPFNTDVRVGDIVGNVISIFLGLLALVFIVLVLIAGFQYMLSREDAGKAKTALTTIRQAVIGLVIILIAYALTKFVFLMLEKVNTSY